MNVNAKGLDAIPEVFVLHVRKGYEERRVHIERLMSRHGLHFEFILDGDYDDISEACKARWFSEDNRLTHAAMSCAYKHLLACRAVVERGLPGALVLEDDVVFSRRFDRLMPMAVGQLLALGDEPALLSMENTRLRFVPRSRRRRGILIYPGDRDRYAACYYINRAGAESILRHSEGGGIDRPIDLFHRLLLEQGKLRYYWMHPTVATQGSFTGQFQSAINPYDRFVEPLKWRLQLAWRQLIYNLR